MNIYPDISVFIQVANFLFLLLLLNILLYRPIRKILGQRKHEVNSLENMIEDFQRKFGQSAQELQENRAGARNEGFKEKENLKSIGLEEEKRMVQEAISSAEEKIGKAKEEIKGKALEANRSLEDELKVFSQELAEKILGRSV